MTTIEKAKNLLERLVGEKVPIDCSQFDNLTNNKYSTVAGYPDYGRRF